MRGLSALAALISPVLAWGQSLPADAGVADSDSLALAALEKGCAANDRAACARLGFYLEMGRSIERNLPRAYELYERACDGGDPFGCTQLGLMQEGGLVKAADVGKARTRYQQACLGGAADGCYRLARLYESGRGGRRSEMKAADLYETACNGGNAAACNALGQIVLEGRANVARDGGLAARLFGRGCRRGDGASCANLATLYEEGRVVERDGRCAIDLAHHGCELGDASACLKKTKGFATGEAVDRCFVPKVVIDASPPAAPLNPLGQGLRYGGLGIAAAGAVFVVLAIAAGKEADDREAEVARARGVWSEALDQAVADGQAQEHRMKVFSAVGGALLVGGGLISWMGDWFREETITPMAGGRGIVLKGRW